jgi:hypothetical protein
MAGDLDALIARQRRAATQLTELFMDSILGEASRLAPVREGTLRASHGRETEQHANGATVTGFFATVYSARQHQELGWRHPMGGQAKYLEQPFNRRAPQYERALAAAVARVT